MFPAIVMLENRDVWPGRNAKWTLSYWKAGFLWASCYCWIALVTNQLLFDFLRSVHIPNLSYAIAHLATAHRWQWDCCTVDILTCPSRKRTGRMNDCCIPLIGGPAIVQVIVPDFTHLCLCCFNKPNCELCGQSLSFDEQAGGRWSPIIKEITVTWSCWCIFVVVVHLASTGVCSFLPLPLGFLLFPPALPNSNGAGNTLNSQFFPLNPSWSVGLPS